MSIVRRMVEINYGTVTVQSLSRVQLFATPWTAACQASLYITNSQSLLKLMFIELVMPSNHLILCCPLLLLPSIFPSIRIFSNESVLCIRWPKYWSFCFSVSPSNDYSGLISFRMDWLDLLCNPRDSQESSPTPQFIYLFILAFIHLFVHLYLFTWLLQGLAVVLGIFDLHCSIQDL